MDDCSAYYSSLVTIDYFTNGKAAIEDVKSRSKDYTGIYRNALSNDRTRKCILAYPNIIDAFRGVAKKLAFKKCISHREYNESTKSYSPYIWKSFGEVNQQVELMAAGLAYLQSIILHNNEIQRNIGIQSSNRPEYMMAELAIGFLNDVVVGIFNSIPSDSMKFILTQTNIQVIFTELPKVASLVEYKKSCPDLKAIVSFDRLGSSKTAYSLKRICKDLGLMLLDLKQLEQYGLEFTYETSVIKSTDIQTIIYTSGTTGEPKGAIITHSAMMHSCMILPMITVIDSSAVSLSSLPLAHCYQRLVDFSFVLSGGVVGYSCGDFTKILDDIQVLRPTLWITVPRILNQIIMLLKEATINRQGLSGILSRRAYNDKLEYYNRKGSFNHPIWDFVFSRKIQKVFGGRLKTILVGSAPISQENLEFLRICLGCDVLNGYGLSETNAVAAMAIPRDPSTLGCGPPLINVEIRLKSLPELNYYVHDTPNPRGELCIRGPTILRGYYKRSDLTKAAIDDEGFFHSGDVAEIDNFGRIIIIDRVKNIFKLSNGEQAFVYGRSDQNYLVAILGINLKKMTDFLSKNLKRNISETEVTKMLDEERVIKYVADLLATELEKKDLAKYEKISAFKLMLEPLSEANGTLSSTQKLKRMEAERYYSKYLNQMIANSTAKATRMHFSSTAKL